MSESRTCERTIPSEGPRALPYCAYPSARDVAHHGLQELPKVLPLVDFVQARPHRSAQHKMIPATRLVPAQVLEMARVVATAFVRRNPISRHLQPPKHPPAGLMGARHTDPFGHDMFGPWTMETIHYWSIRLRLLTDPTSRQSAIRVNEEVLGQSLAIVNQAGEVLGGAFNKPTPPLDAAHAFRQGDLFMTAVVSCLEPARILFNTQNTDAMEALCTQFPAFRDAYARGKVGHHALVARANALATEEAFELLAATMEHYQALGYAYVVIAASHQWTGAACEVLGGVRVHFAPFQAQKTIRESVEPLEGTVTSPNGFLSNKDSGSMFYVIRLT